MPSSATTIAERLRELLELLETCAANRRLLDELSPAERERLHRALAGISNPDPVSRRLQVKAWTRARKAERARKEDTVLDQTGIRTLRRRPVITTPNVFPPPGFEARDSDGDPDIREAIEPQHCYVCKAKYTELHHFYDQLCPDCAAFTCSVYGVTQFHSAPVR